ncbi:MAG TPA: MarR family transcriptional regulator [Candidatus Nanopelagicaceae bacterium]|nr:MarR family transcriptional regulator [Candidatus Nanopelagicaceae bacterium]
MFNQVNDMAPEQDPAPAGREDLVKRFISLQWRLGHAIRTTLTASLGASGEAVSAAVKAATPNQRAVLMALNQEGALAMGELARHLGVSASSATELVDRLVEHGWVERLPTSNDRRAVVVQLTGPAREMAEQARSLLLAGTKTLVGQLNDRELATLVGLLERVTETGPDPKASALAAAACRPLTERAES